MPEQFVVPQFLDVESKIIGSVTMRQFAILMAAILVAVIFYKLFDFVLFLLTAIPWMICAGVVAFVRINGQPFHYFFLNFVQTSRRPNLRVWSKERTDAELRSVVLKKPVPIAVAPYTKPPLTGTRLRDLSLVVNTGGVFVPDDERLPL